MKKVFSRSLLALLGALGLVLGLSSCKHNIGIVQCLYGGPVEKYRPVVPDTIIKVDQQAIESHPQATKE